MVRLRYVVERRGLLFWQPTKEVRDLGFEARPLGAKSPESIAEAERLYQEVVKARAGRGKVTDYPPGTFGAYYDRFTGRLSRKPVPKWLKMKPRSREDYERAWTHLEPAFARKILTKITAQDFEAFIDDGKGGGLALKVSPSERYRVQKVARALFDDAIARLQLHGHVNPAKIVSNPQAPGRSAIWLGSEIDLLVKGAHALGYHGMGVAIRIAWDSLFSPVDIWTLPRKAVQRDRGGWYIERPRTKTDKGAFGALSADTALALGVFIAALPFDLTPDTPIIRQRNGHAYRSKDTFGDDFRAVRLHVFGEEEKRQFMDIRRSGNVEADAAGADKATMGELLANGMATSKFLEDTYTPPTVAKARLVAVQRQEGRRRLAAEIERLSPKKAG